MRHGTSPIRWGNTPSGLSYIEVLLAAAVLTVGILGALGAMSTAGLDIYYGGRETRATELTQSMMERIRNAASYPDLLSYGDSPPAGATSPAPAYVTQNRTTWLASITGAGGGSLGPAWAASPSPRRARLRTAWPPSPWPSIGPGGWDPPHPPW